MTALVALVLLGAVLAAAVYLGWERMGAEGAGLAALRTVAFAALLVMLFNPVTTVRNESAPATVLLDASLSMSAAGAHWERARDSAASLAGPGGTVLRFGHAVAPADSGAPTDGASRLGEALRVAAGRVGPVWVVTDGEIDDRSAIAPSLLDGVGVVTFPRDTVPGAALLDVSLRDRYLEGDSLMISVTVGRWGLPGALDASVEVFLDDRRVHADQIELPENAAAVRRSLPLPPGLVPAGEHVLRFHLAVAGDADPRDDVRSRVVRITARPGVVVIVDPADTEGRFLVRELTSVVQSGVRGYARITPETWVDMTALTPIAERVVERAAREASLVVIRSAERDRFRGASVWHWPAAMNGGTEFFDGDWYVTPDIAPSPLAGRFAAVRWDSVPPLTGIIPVVATGDEWVALTGRLGRRGADRPLLIGIDSSGHRRLTTTSAGLWRWAMRGGAALEAYRATIAAGADWLLETADERGGPGVSVARATPRGRPVVFRWHGGPGPDTLIPVRLVGADTTISLAIAFDGAGEARHVLPPGVYRWTAPALARSNGLIVVEEYSDEFHPRTVTLSAGEAGRPFAAVLRSARERWWWFVLAIGALIGEWAWRQRRGLP